MIRELFPNVELLNSIPPDEVIPIGAALEAGILLGREQIFSDDMLSIECSAKDILVKVRWLQRCCECDIPNLTNFFNNPVVPCDQGGVGATEWN